MSSEIEFSLHELEKYCGHDKKTYSSLNNTDEIEYLCFFDSRGSNAKNENESFSKKLSLMFNEQGVTYLTICRPVNNTTFFTLINFLYLNNYRFSKLITNVGFVDFTPKKKEVIDDVIYQKELLFDEHLYQINELGECQLSKGENQKLFNLDISPFNTKISQILLSEFKEIFLMLTTEYSKICSFERKRPISFYTQLKNTNHFLRNMQKRNKKFMLIPAPTVNDNYMKYSHDGVHLTDHGHKYTFNMIKSVITDSIY